MKWLDKLVQKLYILKWKLFGLGSFCTVLSWLRDRLTHGRTDLMTTVDAMYLLWTHLKRDFLLLLEKPFFWVYFCETIAVAISNEWKSVVTFKFRVTWQNALQMKFYFVTKNLGFKLSFYSEWLMTQFTIVMTKNT